MLPTLFVVALLCNSCRTSITDRVSVTDSADTMPKSMLYITSTMFYAYIQKLRIIEGFSAYYFCTNF